MVNIRFERMALNCFQAVGLHSPQPFVSATLVRSERSASCNHASASALPSAWIRQPDGADEDRRDMDNAAVVATAAEAAAAAEASTQA